MIHIDGIILIDKGKGCTSHDIVNKIKHIFNEKTGHTGTLDPNATGLLPILIGQGTKLSSYLINHDKKYLVKLKLGIKTDTADSEGEVVQEEVVDENMLSKEHVEEILKSFVGKQEQIPPMYSAIKVNGKKLYEYARKNIQVEVKPREIEIYDMELSDISEQEKEIVFSVECSKGTYIRSLCEDIAVKLGTVGYMKELKRTVVGQFNINESITVDELEAHKEDREYMKNHIIDIETFFIKYKNAEKIILNEKKLKLFLNGVKLNIYLKNGDYRIYNEKNEFIGIGSLLNNLLKREIIVEK